MQLWGSPVGATICDTGVHWAEPGREAELEAVVRAFAASAEQAPGFCGFALQQPLPEAEQTLAAFTAKMEQADNSHSLETKVFWRAEADRLAWRESWAGGELSMRGRAAGRLDKKRSGVQACETCWPAFGAAAL